MTNSGTIIMYQTSGSMTGDSPGGATNSQPKNFVYLGLPGVTNINFSGNEAFVGVIYAPEATFTFNGGGSGYGVMGSCVAGSVFQNNHYNFHFDESLLTSGPFR